MLSQYALLADGERGILVGPRGDFVLFRPEATWRIVQSRAIDDFVASDHRPVLTVLEWAGQG